MALIGFIGLGLMGTGFTRRLTGTGNRLAGYDIDPRKVKAAGEWGVEGAGSPGEAAAGAGLVCICVDTSRAVDEVVTGDGGLVRSGNLGGKIVIDFSTTEMGVTRRIASAVTDAGGGFIDAPVSGGPAAAESGSLAIFAGGDSAVIEEARGFLGQLGQVTHMGMVGAGQATKLVNQTLCLTNYCVVAEALRLAEAFGVDSRRIPSALAPGLADSAVLRNVFPRMVERDYSPRGYARQILKDLEMVHEATPENHLAMPMAELATTLFRMLVASGRGDLDGAAIVELLPAEERPAP